jgi:F-box interacting protein
MSLRLIDMDGCLVRVINDMGKYWRPACTGPDDVLCVTGYHGPIGHIAGVIDIATMSLLATRLERNDDDKAWGIGRAVPSGACKVVRFRARLTEVFTIGDGAGWRRMKSLPSSIGYYSLHNYPAAVDGMLYFLAETQSGGDISILRLSLEREKWNSMIKGPPDVTFRSKISLVELNGSLCMVQQDMWEGTNGHVKIWLLLGSDKGIWVNAYTIPFDPRKYYQMMPLRVLHGGPKLLLLCNRTWKGGAPRLQIYDPRYGTCIDATKKLLRHHVPTANYNVSIGLCNMQLEHFISPNIQCLSTLSEVFL